MTVRLLTIIAAATLVGGSAFAADLRTPVYKAPVAPRADDWSGPYIGAHLGYDWGRTRVLDNGVLTESGARTNGVLGGVLAGYNWQRGLFVFGLEADIAAAAIRGSGTVAAPPPPPNQYVVNSNGDIRARFGYIIFPGTLIFVSGGVALRHRPEIHAESDWPDRISLHRLRQQDLSDPAPRFLQCSVQDANAAWRADLAVRPLGRSQCRHRQRGDRLDLLHRKS